MELLRGDLLGSLWYPGGYLEGRDGISPALRTIASPGKLVGCYPKGWHAMYVAVTDSTTLRVAVQYDVDGVTI